MSSSPFYHIKGPPNVSPGIIPPRLEIYDFVKNEKHFTLYIRALIKIAEEEESATSAFEISGIHDIPLKPWKGGDLNDLDGDEKFFYCVHGTALFPIWHRAYMSLYESSMKLPPRLPWNTRRPPRSFEAAERLRLPYWDWAAKAIPPDQVILDEKVTITLPGCIQSSVKNPLLAYKFLDPKKIALRDCPNYPTTVRHPAEDGQSSPQASIKRLNAEFKGAQRDIYRALTQLNTWEEFSNRAAKSKPPFANSLEAIHDNIHMAIGGGGHMTTSIVLSHFSRPLIPMNGPLTLGVRAFRILQACVCVDKIIPALEPFRDGNNNFWNAANSYQYKALGYTYPEFADLGDSSPDEIKSVIRRKIELLYQRPGVRYFSQLGAFEWTIRIHSGGYDLGGSSFWVLIFLGEPPADSNQWFASAEYVGYHAVFANSEYQTCSNCIARKGLIESILEVGEKIKELGELGTMTFRPEVVRPYLEKKPNWRVLKVEDPVLPIPLRRQLIIFAKVDGTEVHVRDLPSLEIIPISRGPWPSENLVLHPHITKGRAGGAK
ncbi:hypothetical protein BOTBODRAFT_145757 [Botryobasidium botryosum FD-172 SS1]|uniref:tyrosinase n=1 Tax=Botryobasidium botryosum (strain FD-172 SS1) TaxID=930990 RepID=A0A067ME78_BOTB1|nr:hypothetical protein BOTBODRAFT_145757 [Botryobasidium botryosum FD-172 SS1]